MGNISLRVEIQNVGIKFSSNFEPLVAFAESHFNSLSNGCGAIPSPAAVESRLEWIEAVAPLHSTRTISEKNRFDRALEFCQGEIVWTRIDDFSDLRLSLFPLKDRLRLVGQHFFFLDRKPLRDRLKKVWFNRRLASLRRKRFSTLIYYMIYYPCFWRLEQNGLLPLHAAAVDLGGAGVVLCGLPGSGKSTLSLALLAEPGSRLLSDNIIFYDSERVFSCPEPVLVDDRSVDLIGPARSVLRPVGRRHVFHRSWCHVAPDRCVDQVVPRVFFFVALGEKTAVRPLSAEEAYRRFIAANTLAKEVRRYLIYRSVLELGTTGNGTSNGGNHLKLRELLSHSPTYELTIGWNRGVASAVSLVESLAHESRS
ncbi:MAG TPA: hypothetical protein VNO43_01750 [Candidatus Eisenbacteria bacterium]|nr:hypothetical protein [Candidatus Eisenbacteria bacterium]